MGPLRSDFIDMGKEKSDTATPPLPLPPPLAGRRGRSAAELTQLTSSFSIKSISIRWESDGNRHRLIDPRISPN